MSVAVRRFGAVDLPRISRLNKRLRAHDVAHPVYAEGDGTSEAATSVPGLCDRLYVADDGEEIRGAAWLREQEFWVGGASVRAGWIKYPVAESLIDPRFSGVPAALVLRLVREQPLLMGLGLGGQSTPLARLLAQLGWTGTLIPMLVRVERPAKVLREAEYVRGTSGRRLLTNLLATTGLGWAAYRGYSLLKSRPRFRDASSYLGETAADFGGWADELWERYRDCYGFVALRNSAMLNAIYPPSFEQLARIRVSRAGDDVGWVVAIHVDFQNRAPDPHFGTLRVGLIADCFGRPEHAAGIVARAVEHLRGRRVDLLFSNQAHPVWRASLGANGFVPAPSNFAFYRSPQVQALLEQSRVERPGMHLNRGDCDGPRWW